MSRLTRLRRKLRHRGAQRDRQRGLWKRTGKRGHAKAATRDARAVRFLRHLIRRVSRQEHRHAHDNAVLVMFDSVDLDQVPADAPAVAGYTSGSWPTYADLATRFPAAKRLSIAVSASDDAQCLDIEAGDASPSQAPDWVKRQHSRGVRRPVVYCSVSSMDEVWGLLRGAGIKRNQVRLWSAHYGRGKHLCGPKTCGEVRSITADATQWCDDALGRNLDESVLRPMFF